MYYHSLLLFWNGRLMPFRRAAPFLGPSIFIGEVCSNQVDHFYVDLLVTALTQCRPISGSARRRSGNKYTLQLRSDKNVQLPVSLTTGQIT